MRINGFEQIKGFYSWVFNNQEKGIKPQHTSLYVFLINQNNRNSWAEWFKCPYDLAMAGSCISSKKTYYQCLKDLTDWKLIEYTPGLNNWKAPMIKIIPLKDGLNVPQSEKVEVQISTSTVPQPIQADVPQHIQALIQAATPQPIHNIKLVTSNFKLITDNLDSILLYLKKSVAKTPPPEFSPCLDFWLKEFHLGWTFGGQQGKALKSIITKLKKILKDKDGEPPASEKVIALFKNMCIKLPDWFKDKDLNILDSKFNEIISEIQNGQNANSGKIGKSNISDIAKVFEQLKDGPTAEEIRNRGFGN